MKRLLFGISFIAMLCTNVYFFFNKQYGLPISLFGFLIAYLFVLYEAVQEIKRQITEEDKIPEKQPELDITELYYSDGIMSGVN